MKWHQSGVLVEGFLFSVIFSRKVKAAMVRAKLTSTHPAAIDTSVVFPRLNYEHHATRPSVTNAVLYLEKSGYSSRLHNTSSRGFAALGKISTTEQYLFCIHCL